MKTALRVVVLGWLVTLAWAFMPLAASADFTQQDFGTYVLWSQSSTNTYFQQYKADYSWYDSTNSSSGFSYMGKLADIGTLLFDGSFHKFTDNNYSYEFWQSGTGVWQNASLNLNQYAYDYNLGQWYDQGNWGGWATLGTSGLSTAFMGDSSGQTLGTDSRGITWNYLFDGTYGYWQNTGMSNLQQFAYDYVQGQWWNEGHYGGWQALGGFTGVSASFLGDGSTYSLGNNWSYSYDGAYGYWMNGNMNNLQQFAYDYSSGTWYDQGNWGGWAVLSPPEVSAWFVGDGNWHTPYESTWSYMYDGTYGYFRNNNLNVIQYAYNYNSGQWSDQGNWGGWASLGNPNLSASFMGDGTVHNIGTMGGVDWTYRCDGTYGYWHNQTLNLDQFAYDYSAGWHYDQGIYGGWASIGYANTGAYFLGNGYFYNNPANPSGYQYDGALNLGKFWSNLAGAWIGAYDYNSGQWYMQGNGSTGGWQPLGLQQMSAWIMFDGQVHNLDANWSFQMITGVGGLWTYIPSGLTLFKFQYTNSQWFDQGQYGGWAALSNPGASAAFVGDGNSHGLGIINGIDWSYNFDGTFGYWNNPNMGNLKQFAYNYGGGVWMNQGYYGGWYGLAYDPIGTVKFSAAFVGDGSPHDVGVFYGVTDWYYRFDGTYGYWHNDSLDFDQFAYNYYAGSHYAQGRYGGWAGLGYANTGAYHLGNGFFYNNPAYPWGYQYDGSLNLGKYYSTAYGIWAYAYDYNTGMWYLQGGTTGFQPLSPAQWSAWFMGDGNSHPLDTNSPATWQYRHVSGVGGVWTYNGLDVLRYSMANAQWFDQGPVGGWIELSDTGTTAAFMGDGSQHFLGSGAVGQGNYYAFHELNMPASMWWVGTSSDPPTWAYDYILGQWYQWDSGGSPPGWYPYGSPGQSAALPVGSS